MFCFQYYNNKVFLRISTKLTVFLANVMFSVGKDIFTIGGTK